VRRSSRNVDTYGCPVFVLPVRLICTIVAKWYLLVWPLVFNCVLWSVTLAWCFYCKSSKEEVCGAVEGSSWPQWRSEMVGERRQPQFEWHSFNTRAHRCTWCGSCRALYPKVRTKLSKYGCAFTHTWLSLQPNLITVSFFFVSGLDLSWEFCLFGILTILFWRIPAK
jgi:hypothetical protein